MSLILLYFSFTGGRVVRLPLMPVLYLKTGIKNWSWFSGTREALDPEFLKSNPLSLDLMVNDGIELAEYLTKRLGKQKIILFGTSWGSALGARMAFERPDLFHAYIGHSQLVNPSEDNELTYQKLLRLVQEDRNERR